MAEGMMIGESPRPEPSILNPAAKLDGIAIALEVLAATIAVVAIAFPPLGVVSAVSVITAIFVRKHGSKLRDHDIQMRVAQIDTLDRELDALGRELEKREQRTIADQDLFLLQIGHSGGGAIRISLPFETMWSDMEQSEFHAELYCLFEKAGWRVHPYTSRADMSARDPVGITLRTFISKDGVPSPSFEDVRYALMRAGVRTSVEIIDAKGARDEIELVVGPRARM